MDSFNLKKFLVENKLTASSRLLNEEAEPDFKQEAKRFSELVAKHGEAAVTDALEGLYDNARDAVEAGHATSIEDAYKNSLEMLEQDPRILQDLLKT